MEFHNGVDFPNRMDGQVVAPVSGKVTVNTSPKGGNQILITDPVTKWVVGIAHTRANVKDGQWVVKGEPIGVTDGSGDSRGAHVHVTVRPPDGDRLDPTTLFRPYP